MAFPNPTVPDDEIEKNKRINEMYKIWKKNCPVLYEHVYSKALKWPSLTCQWFPDVKESDDGIVQDFRYLIGSNTSGKEQEYVMLGHIEVPTETAKDKKYLNSETNEIGGIGGARRPFKNEIMQKINHEGEVNKARYMPQKPDVIATLGVGGTCYIFDRTKHPNEPKNDDFRADMRLVGHKDEGFGLVWYTRKEGILATASQDKTVRLWDLQGFSNANSQHMKSTRVVTTHSDVVNDVQFHTRHPLFATCSDDKTYAVHDLRQEKPILQSAPTSDAINCLTWHFDASHEWRLLTGHADGKIAAWDIRKPNEKSHSFDYHEDAVVKVQWLPKQPKRFASASYDRQICYWNYAKIGAEQTPEDAEDGPPEMSFVHGGFVDNVTDFDVAESQTNLTMASAEDNQLMVFQPAHAIMYPELIEEERNRALMRNVEE